MNFSNIFTEIYKNIPDLYKVSGQVIDQKINIIPNQINIIKLNIQSI